MDAQKQNQMYIISDMTRQYKSVEEDLLDQIARLEKRKLENSSEISDLEDKKKQLKQEIEQMTKDKQEKVEALKKKIETMSQDFQAMLQNTLENMKKKIKDANQKWENENEGAMLNRFQEYTTNSKTS